MFNENIGYWSDKHQTNVRSYTTIGGRKVIVPSETNLIVGQKIFGWNCSENWDEKTGQYFNISKQKYTIDTITPLNKIRAKPRKIKSKYIKRSDMVTQLDKNLCRYVAGQKVFCFCGKIHDLKDIHLLTMKDKHETTKAHCCSKCSTMFNDKILKEPELYLGKCFWVTWHGRKEIK